MILPTVSLDCACQGSAQSSPALSARLRTQHYVWLDKKEVIKNWSSHEEYNRDFDHLPTPWQHVDWTLFRPLLSLAEVCLEDLWVGQWQPCVRQYFQLKELPTKISMRSAWHPFAYLVIVLVWLHIAHIIYHLFATTWRKKINSLKRNTYLSSRLSEEVLHFHLFKLTIRCATTQQKKYLPIWTYFLMLSCFVFFSLAIDTAAVFLVGGPIFKWGCEEFACDCLDLEDDATLTMRECWWRAM